MKLKLLLDPLKYDGKAADWQDWQKKFVDFEPTRNSWFYKLRKNYQHFSNNGKDSVFMDSVKTCPSFMNSFKNRIIIRNIADLYVGNSNGTIQFRSSHPFGEEKHINFHKSSQLGNEFPFQTGMFKDPVKFLSPFLFCFSETVDVIINPVWWDKSNETVQAIPGLVRIPKNDPIEFNINTFVKQPEKNTSYVIEAGTPLCQVLITEVKKPKIFFVKSLNKKIIDKRLNDIYQNLATQVSLRIKRYMIR